MEMGRLWRCEEKEGTVILGKVERRGGEGSWTGGVRVGVGATCAGRDGVWGGTGAPGLGALFFCWMHTGVPAMTGQ